jgi:hypothetical protein
LFSFANRRQPDNKDQDMKHEPISAGASTPRRRTSLRSVWRRGSRRLDRTAASEGHSAAVTRLAEVCAAIGGTSMLHDLMPDVVTFSFGERTEIMRERLHALGWTFVGTGSWQGEPVLGVSFAGDRRANRTAGEFAAALVRIAGELEVAETRLW